MGEYEGYCKIRIHGEKLKVTVCAREMKKSTERERKRGRESEREKDRVHQRMSF